MKHHAPGVSIFRINKRNKEDAADERNSPGEICKIIRERSAPGHPRLIGHALFINVHNQSQVGGLRRPRTVPAARASAPAPSPRQ